MAGKKRTSRARHTRASREVKEDKNTAMAPSTNPYILRLPDELLSYIFSLTIDDHPNTPRRTPHDRNRQPCRSSLRVIDDSLIQFGQQIGLQAQRFLVCKRVYNIAEEVIRGSTTRLLSVHLIYGEFHFADIVFMLLRGSLSRHRLILDYVKKLYLEFVTDCRPWHGTADPNSCVADLLVTLPALEELHVKIAKQGPADAVLVPALRQSLLDASADMSLRYQHNVKVYFRGQAGFEDFEGIIDHQPWEWYDE